MWETTQFSLLIVSCTLLIVTKSSDLPKFAMYSEFCWLSIYMLVILLSSFIDTPELFSTPFIILILTAVEAVIIWSLITLINTSTVK